MRRFAFLLLIGSVFSTCRSIDRTINPAYSPIPTYRALPEYPELLKRAGFEAIVELSALVDESGNVIDVKVVESTPLVDSICVEATRKWKYRPGKLSDSEGKYREARFWVPVFFDWNNSREELVKVY
jgi:TonB family protein